MARYAYSRRIIALPAILFIAKLVVDLPLLRVDDKVASYMAWRCRLIARFCRTFYSNFIAPCTTAQVRQLIATLKGKPCETNYASQTVNMRAGDVKERMEGLKSVGSP